MAKYGLKSKCSWAFCPPAQMTLTRLALTPFQVSSPTVPLVFHAKWFPMHFYFSEPLHMLFFLPGTLPLFPSPGKPLLIFRSWCKYHFLKEACPGTYLFILLYTLIALWFFFVNVSKIVVEELYIIIMCKDSLPVDKLHENIHPL